MKLNADLGESFGHWQMNADKDIMPFIDMANIACGGHAGDPSVMYQTIALAKSHGVSIGAHPSYPDIQGFGRRSMAIPTKELSLIIQAQLATLDGLARCQGKSLSHVKTHGALYNDMMSNESVRRAVFEAIKTYYINLPLVVQATTHNEKLLDEAKEYGISLMFEAFADRLYLDSGFLCPRKEQGAVLNYEESVEQSRRLIQEGELITDSGKTLKISADTLCVHGDTPEAIRTVEKIRQILLGQVD